MYMGRGKVRAWSNKQLIPGKEALPAGSDALCVCALHAHHKNDALWRIWKYPGGARQLGIC